MSKKCINCHLVNFPDNDDCIRCGTSLETADPAAANKATLTTIIAKRAAICVMVCLFVLAGFYLSLIGSAKSLAYEDKQAVNRSIAILNEKGFSEEVFLLQNLAAYRASDNWLNASVEKENAYAATNFPFEIITIYPDFFIYPIDDTERAAILLHEAKHLTGKDEKTAYEFVWKNRDRLGWTRAAYRGSLVWQNVRKQTKESVPELFACPEFELGDCTEATFRK